MIYKNIYSLQNLYFTHKCCVLLEESGMAAAGKRELVLAGGRGVCPGGGDVNSDCLFR